MALLLALAPADLRGEGSPSPGADPNGGGPGGGGPNPPPGCPKSPIAGPGASTTTTPKPVVLINGSLREVATDASLPGTGVSWGHTRTYNSALTSTNGTPLAAIQGQKWEVQMATSLVRWDASSNITLTVDAHQNVPFTWNGTGYSSRGDFRGTLVQFKQADNLTGSAASGTTTSVTVAGSPYTANALVGRMIRFTSGTNASLCRVITANTASSISWSDALPNAVAASDGFAIQDRVVLTMTDSQETFVFAGNNGNWPQAQQGLLLSRTDAYGNIQTYSWSNLGAAGLRLNAVTTSQGWSVAYGYVNDYWDTNNGRLSSLTVKNGTSQAIQKVYYTYMIGGSYSGDCGTDGDLIQVKILTRASSDDLTNSADGAFSIVRTSQYRYDSAHHLKAVYEPEDVRQIMLADTSLTTPEAILAKTNSYSVGGGAQLHTYASREISYYAADLLTNNSGPAKCLTMWQPTSGENLESLYGGSNLDETGFVQTETVRSGAGCSSCGSSSSGGMTYRYYYLQISQGTNPTADKVTRIVVEDLTDANGTAVSRKLYGLNTDGIDLRGATVIDDSGTKKYWCTSTLVGTTGSEIDRPTEVRQPSAHTGVSDTNIAKFLNPTSGTNDADTVNASSGLVNTYKYNANGYREAAFVKQGASGTEYYTGRTVYGGVTDGGTDFTSVPSRLVVRRYSFPGQVQRNDTTPPSGTSSANDYVYTEYSYTFWDTSAQTQLKTQTTKLPAVPLAQLGSNTQDASSQYLDKAGRLRWSCDTRGRITYYSYHPSFGFEAYTLRDVDTSNLPSDVTAGASGKWVAWVNPDTSDATVPTGFTNADTTAAKLANSSEFDDLGRETKTTAPGNQTTYTVYKNQETREYPSWDTSTNTPRLPIQVTKLDYAGHTTESYAVALTLNGNTITLGLTATNAPSGSESLPQSNYTRWSKSNYDAHGQLVSTDAYYLIPSTGAGSSSANYLHTGYSYDALGRQYAVIAPDGTIRWTEFDNLGRAIETWVGTDATGASPGSPAAGSSNLKRISKVYFDAFGPTDSSTTYTVGDGLAFESRAYTSDTAFLATKNQYDWRDRLTDTRGPDKVATKSTLDNLGRATLVQTYADANENFTIEGGTSYELRIQSETTYDARGQVYQTRRYKVDSDTPAVRLTDLTWHDGEGHIIKAKGPNGQFAKTRYDGLERVVGSYLCYDDTETDTDAGSYGQAGTLDNDTVIRQTLTSYDVNGKVWLVRGFARHDNGTGTGELTTANARVTYAATWYDAALRLSKTVDYGTNGGTGSTNPITAQTDTTFGNGQSYAAGGPAVSNSNAWIVSTVDYDADGRVYQRTDNAGRVTRTEFDALARTTATIENYVDGGTNPDQNRRIEYHFDAQGRNDTITAKGASAGDQTTTYLYGTPLGDAAPAIYRNDLLRAVVYPDATGDGSTPTSLTSPSSGSYDHVEYTYDRLGRWATLRDQNKTVHEYRFDSAGRLYADAVTTFGSNIDQRVQRVALGFDDQGRIQTVTSYDNPTDGAGTALDQVQHAYDGWGHALQSWQAHGGLVNTATTPSVQVGYADGASGNEAKYLRPTNLVYPTTTRTLYYNYLTDGSIGDRLSRMDNMADDATGTTKLAQYTYAGANMLLKIAHPQVATGLNLDYGSGGTYTGLDNLGRIIDQKWTQDDATVVARVEHGYDNASNRTYRKVTGGGATLKDQAYGYDGLDRLIDTQNGNLKADRSGIDGTPAREEAFNLDKLGNWSGNASNASGYQIRTTGALTLDQSRSYNLANEVGTIGTNTTGLPVWVSPQHDAAGNMTQGPRPADGTVGHKYIYDAWNRLVKVTDTADVAIAQYRYDGLNRRIAKIIPNGANWDRTDYYYNRAWQVLEERSATGQSDPDAVAATALYQYVWDLRYIDALVARDTISGATNTRHYFAQDSNFNTVAGLTVAGAVVERYNYDSYGQVSVYDGNWGTPSSPLNNPVLFAGYRLDAETNLYQARSRYLHPTLGRWLTRDPIGYTDSLSFYQYVASHPIGMTDPSGAKLYASGSEQTQNEVNTLLTGDIIDTYDYRWSVTGTEDKVALVFRFVSNSCDCDSKKEDETETTVTLEKRQGFSRKDSFETEKKIGGGLEVEIKAITAKVKREVTRTTGVEWGKETEKKVGFEDKMKVKPCSCTEVEVFQKYNEYTYKGTGTGQSVWAGCWAGWVTGNGASGSGPRWTLNDSSTWRVWKDDYEKRFHTLKCDSKKCVRRPDEQSVEEPARE